MGNRISRSSLSLYWLALLAGLGPLLAIHMGYLVAANLGHVDWCLPYWDGCTSISKVGRKPPVVMIYRGLMIPAAVTAALLWWWLASFFRTVGLATERFSRWLVVCGVLGSLFLIQYQVALGEVDRLYRLFRFSGVLFGVGFTFAAQLLVTRLLATKEWLELGDRRSRSLKAILWSYLVIGIVSQLCKTLMTEQQYEDRWQDAFEWWFFLMFALWYLLLARQLKPVKAGVVLNVDEHKHSQ